jgi:hypothetical protein
MSRFVMTVDGALDSQLCARIVWGIDGDPLARVGQTGLGLDAARKVSTDLDITGVRRWATVERALRLSLNAGLRDYIAVNESLASVARLGCPGLRLRRYDTDGFFDWHIDSFDLSVATRVLALVWYLNDADGGATEFLYQGLRITPRTGRLLMFPTGFEYVHRSQPVTSGAKYVAVGFLEHCG